MVDVKEYIKQLYGIELNEVQLTEFIIWYKRECSACADGEEICKIEEYLSEKFGGILLLEEDLSSIQYLLISLLKNQKR